MTQFIRAKDLIAENNSVEFKYVEVVVDKNNVKGKPAFEKINSKIVQVRLLDNQKQEIKVLPQTKQNQYFQHKISEIEEANEQDYYKYIIINKEMMYNDKPYYQQDQYLLRQSEIKQIRNIKPYVKEQAIQKSQPDKSISDKSYKETIDVLQKQDTLEELVPAIPKLIEQVNFSQAYYNNMQSSLLKFEEDSNNAKFSHYSKILMARYISLELTDLLLYQMVEQVVALSEYCFRGKKQGDIRLYNTMLILETILQEKTSTSSKVSKIYLSELIDRVLKANKKKDLIKIIENLFQIVTKTMTWCGI